MKKIITTIISTSFFLSAFCAQADSQVSTRLLDRYTHYSTENIDLPLRLEEINRIIDTYGGIDRTIELANEGYDKPSFAIGSLHLHGHVFEKDIEKAVSLLEKGSEKGPYSQFELGMYYLNPYNRFVHNSSLKSRGASLIYEAAETGLKEAQYVSAKLLIEGVHITEDRDMAIIFLNNAASHGYEPATVMLQNINTIHTEFRESFDKIQRGALEGHLPSMVRLGEFYYHGWRVTSDKIKAKRLFEYAAIRGSDKASMLLTTLSFD